jgi:hypothetical protein
MIQFHTRLEEKCPLQLRNKRVALVLSTFVILTSAVRTAKADGSSLATTVDVKADGSEYPAQGPPTPTQNSSNSFIDDWLGMVSATQADQPHWITPLVTVTPRLEQEFRYDISRQVQPNGKTVLDNYGGSKGLEIIPSAHTEIIVSLPPYIVRSSNGIPDGVGDVSFLLKYRLLSANEEHGNYIVTAFLGASAPTGSYANGTKDATITPTLAFGKGWADLDVTSTIGAILPVAETNLIGRQIVWNNALQYRLLRKIWPEVEVNSTFFSNGPDDGKKQTFITPGLVFGRFVIRRRLGMTVGSGVQIAATQFHTYNHKYIFTLRVPF